MIKVFNVKTSSGLQEYLIRSKWIKQNNLETIIFLDNSKILYENINPRCFRIDDYYIISKDKVIIKWSSDNFISFVDFNEQYDSFTENKNQEYSWNLVYLDYDKNLKREYNTLTQDDCEKLKEILKKQIEDLIVEKAMNKDGGLQPKIDILFELISKLF